MTLFSKPKNPQPAAPRVCDRCRKQLGTVEIRLLAGARAGSPAASDGRAASWWLCVACDESLRRNDPETS